MTVEQMMFADMPKRLFQCTPSRLATFDCPRRYRFTYVDRPTPERGLPWAHNSVGATVHLSLSQWYQLPVELRTVAGAGDLVEDNWISNGFRDEEQSAQWRSVARRWVEQYVTEHDATLEPIGIERTAAFKNESLSVSGRIDRIDLRDGELVIVDYKTGRGSFTSDDARGSQALALYVLAARRTLRRDCHRVELHHLPTATIAAFEHTDESLERHIQRAQATADDIVTATDTLASGANPDEVFPPNPGPGCSWCDFRKHCPEGRAVSADREPWDGLFDAAG